MADDYEAPRIQDKALNEATLSNGISVDFLPLTFAIATMPMRLT
jgi:hypothetical protein